MTTTVTSSGLQVDTIDINQLPPHVKADLERARKLALTDTLPTQPTKVGCVIASGADRYVGINIRHHFGMHTHAEEMAIDNVVLNKGSIDRVALYAVNDANTRTNKPAFPCGNCRELLLHMLRRTGQADVEIFALQPNGNQVTIAHLQDLLPLSDTLI